MVAFVMQRFRLRAIASSGSMLDAENVSATRSAVGIRCCLRTGCYQFPEDEHCADLEALAFKDEEELSGGCDHGGVLVR